MNDFATLSPDSELGCSECGCQLWRLLTTEQVACASCSTIGHPVNWVAKRPIAEAPEPITCPHRVFKLTFEGAIRCADEACDQTLAGRWAYEPVEP